MIKKVKNKRVSGAGQYRVLSRHQRRMEDPNWAKPFARRERQPYSLSGK